MIINSTINARRAVKIQATAEKLGISDAEVREICEREEYPLAHLTDLMILKANGATDDGAEK